MTNQAGFTPGPWRYDKANLSIWEDKKSTGPDDNRFIAEIASCVDIENGSLIASAPDLLEACKAALADLEGIMPEFEPSGDRQNPAWSTIKELSNAISKAEGIS